MNTDKISKLFKHSLDIQEVSARNSSAAFLQHEPMLFTAYSMTLSAIHEAMQRNVGLSGNEDTEVKDRLLLSGSFYQGIFVAERITRESYYVQASTVIRQQLECLAAIVEAKNGRRIPGRTPNISTIAKAFGRNYGNLSELAHVSVPKKLETIFSWFSHNTEKPVVLIVPLFNYQVAKELYSLNLVLVFLFASELHDLFCALYGSGLLHEELVTLDHALGLLNDIGGLSEAHLIEANNTFQRLLES